MQQKFLKLNHNFQGFILFVIFSFATYVLYKFSELLELNDLLKHFSLLKSREKLQQQDAIWKNICKELQWEFIPSI